VFNKDIKVPLQEAELVGTSSSNTKKQQEKNTCPHCIKFYRIKPHRVSEDKCMWNKKYKRYRFKSICDKLEVAFKHRHKFAADLGGYAEQDSDGSGSD
jgi:hypothetical protein